ncbi:hypothetical protein C0J52_08012 [Blattella germanica]|nr:hypothetical protein C0J52_08012 [Blattella germanica]
MEIGMALKAHFTLGTLTPQNATALHYPSCGRAHTWKPVPCRLLQHLLKMSASDQRISRLKINHQLDAMQR